MTADVFSTGTRMESWRPTGTEASGRDGLKMSRKTPASWCAQLQDLFVAADVLALKPLTVATFI